LELLELPANALEELPEEANLHLAGAVLVSPLDLAVLHRLQQQNVPYVLLQNDLSDGVSHCVCCNYAKGIMQATLHLLNQGREDIRLITAEVQRYSSDQMRMGYEMAHEARGRIVDRSRILEAEYSVELAYQIISKWLKDDNLPDGAIFPTERMASVAMDALHHAGVGIGTEIAIVGFGMPSDKLLPITLTVIDAHNERLGKAAMELLQTMIDGQSPKRRRILIDPELVPAESTQG
jgi:LacI family purine nucleotide synthesis repressor